MIGKRTKNPQLCDASNGLAAHGEPDHEQGGQHEAGRAGKRARRVAQVLRRNVAVNGCRADARVGNRAHPQCGDRDWPTRVAELPGEYHLAAVFVAEARREQPQQPAIEGH
jgi:hypothetical protein